MRLLKGSVKSEPPASLLLENVTVPAATIGEATESAAVASSNVTPCSDF